MQGSNNWMSEFSIFLQLIRRFMIPVVDEFEIRSLDV